MDVIHTQPPCTTNCNPIHSVVPARRTAAWCMTPFYDSIVQTFVLDTCKGLTPLTDSFKSTHYQDITMIVVTKLSDISNIIPTFRALGCQKGPNGVILPRYDSVSRRIRVYGEKRCQIYFFSILL